MTTTEGLADDSPAALFALSDDVRLLTINRAFETLTGLSASAATGRPLRDILTPTSQILYALKVEPAVLQTGVVQEILVEVQSTAGRALPALLTITSPPGLAVRHGVLFPAPERRAYELELIAARKAADAANAARDLLLREVYHRVKNNLQTVDSLLLLQARRLADPEAVAALQVMRKRVFALGLVHHQLMGSADLQTFDVAAFLQELVGHLHAGSDGHVRIEVAAAALAVGLDVAIPLGLIVTELVTNAFERTFPGGEGAVRVTLCATGEDELVLRVADDGVGPPESASPDAFGLSIVKGLAGQLGGRFHITENTGRLCEVRFPKPRAP